MPLFSVLTALFLQTAPPTGANGAARGGWRESQVLRRGPRGVARAMRLRCPSNRLLDRQLKVVESSTYVIRLAAPTQCLLLTCTPPGSHHPPLIDLQGQDGGRSSTKESRVPKSRVLQPRHQRALSRVAAKRDERDWRGSHASRLLMAPTRPSATASAASASKLWARKFKR